MTIDQPGRTGVRQKKLRLIAQRRKTHQQTAAQSKAALIRGMISNLTRAVTILNASIEADLESARVRDPAHFAFPTAIRAMMVRRDNLQASMVALTERLADTDGVPSDLFAA